MYRNVGGELKFWAKTVVILTAIPSILFGIGLLFYGMAEGGDLGILWCIGGIAVGIVGYFLARFSGILIYAFGELVEKTASVDSRLEQHYNGTAQSNKTATPPTPQPTGAPWKCPMCGHENRESALYCGKCGHVR